MADRSNEGDLANLLELVEKLAAGLLEVSGPCSPGDVAKRNLFHVTFCYGPAEASSNGFLRTLSVRYGSSVRDIEFAIAHELIELHLEGKRLGLHHEDLCDRGARALVMPRTVFLRTVAEIGPELLELARLFPYAPLEQIAFRLVDLGLAAAGSCWVGVRVQHRVLASGLTFTQALEWAEFDALGSVYGHGKHRRRQQLGPFQTIAWRTRGPAPNAAVVVCQVAANDHPGLLVLKYVAE